jgi:hypothetical protein
MAPVADDRLERELEIAKRRSICAHVVVLDEMGKTNLERNVNIGGKSKGSTVGSH